MKRTTPMQTIAIAATFTADLLEAPLAFWMQELQFPARVVFAPFNQVFQQLLNPASLLGANTAGINIVLVRLEDWHRPDLDSGIPDARDKLLREAEEFATALAAAADRSATPYLVLLCPASPALVGNPKGAALLRDAEAL